MQTFLALVHKDEDSAYGVSFPDLPGCYSAADEARDIIPNAMEALELWFEHAPHTEPSDIASIRTQVSEDLGEGAFLIAIPYDPASRVAAQ